MFPTPDRELRKLVAQIASISPEDIAAILATLDAMQRSRVEALLAEYSGVSEFADAEFHLQSDPALSGLKGLSPWLAVRLDRAPSQASGARAGEEAAYTMTSDALQALDQSAVAVREGMRRADKQVPA